MKDIMNGGTSCKNGYRKLEKIAFIIRKRGITSLVFALIFGGLCASMIAFDEYPKLELLRAIIDTGILGLLPPVFIIVLLALAYVRRLWKKTGFASESSSVSTSGSTTPGRNDGQAMTPRTAVDDSIRVPSQSAKCNEFYGGRKHGQSGIYAEELGKSITTSSNGNIGRQHAW